MRKGGITALFLRLSFGIQLQNKKFRQTGLIFLHAGYVDIDILVHWLVCRRHSCTLVILTPTFLHAGLISTSTQDRRCVLP